MSNLGKNILFALTVMSISSISYGGEKSKLIDGKDINALKIHTTHNPTASARNIVQVRLKDLDAPCTQGVYFDMAGNSGTYSLLLAAIASKNSIFVTYDLNQNNLDWGETRFCALTGIQYEN